MAKSVKKFILNFTPTGMIPTKEMTRLVPLTPEATVEDVLKAAELGANMVHLHARNPDTGLPTYKKEIYAEIISGIKQAKCDIIICVSTSGRNHSDFKKRSDVLTLKDELKPDFGSLTLSSLNFNQQASVNTPEMIKKLAATMLENNIRPELEVFDTGMINYAKYLLKKGLIRPPCYFNLILGNIACAQANIHSLSNLIRDLPAHSFWSAGGIGNEQFRMNVMALLEGGGIRIGLEDNIWYDEERTRPASNSDLLKRILTVADALEMKPYKPNEVKELFGL
jgi:3-keto-5-aminohexanoate cleavage enzyme